MDLRARNALAFGGSTPHTLPRMDAFAIQGGRKLSGTTRVNGSKNAALPLMAASLLTDERITLRDVPRLSDITNLLRLLGELGVEHADPEPGTLELRVTDRSDATARYDIVRTMRASICVLGPLLARRGWARVSMPGGCNIGDRPVDLHLRGLRALGAEIHLEAGYVVARAPADGRLVGDRVFLGGPFGSTVLGTANVLSAAVLAEGETIIESAACEPEIVDLARLLSAMGASIEGAGSPRIRVQGVPALGGAEHTVLPDRIEAGTLLLAGAITGGDVTLDNAPVECLTALLDRLGQAGVSVETAPGPPPFDGVRGQCRVAGGARPEAVQVTTQPYPGFPTDLQAQIMALLTIGHGNSIVTEKIFPDRFLHVAELLRMGAELIRNGPNVLVLGAEKLVGAPVMASDLRASAGLVLAGLAASGTTTVRRVYHLDRGYESLEERLRTLGAEIERVDEAEL